MYKRRAVKTRMDLLQSLEKQCKIIQKFTIKPRWRLHRRPPPEYATEVIAPQRSW